LIAASRRALPKIVAHEKFVTVGAHNPTTNNHFFSRFIYVISRNGMTDFTRRAGRRAAPLD